ncbi:MAG TPA: hypothetical protein VLF20_04795 [Patescibacteria group bacterium]|nr:hypothetical protein [Patescibacteria group bacterium]
MVQEFQTLPPQAPLPPKPKPFWQKIKDHKMVIIIGCVAFFLLIGTGVYFISPLRQALFAPATDEKTDTQTILPLSPTPKQINQQMPLEATPTALPTPLPATAWKTYTNSLYGYTIKYPPDWTVQNLGQLEPKVPSYIAFIPPSASSGARLITVTISTRTYQEQLALGSSSSAITAAGITGTKQFFQDSNGKQSTAVILPRTNNLLILRAKTEALSMFNLMLSTLTSNK